MNYLPKYYSRIIDICKYLPILGFLILQGCSSILAEDISNQIITINTPQEGVTLQEGNVNFKWENIEHAEHFQIQIVTPSFSAISSFEIDSLVLSNDVSFSLIPNSYEWRVRAQNNAFETQYSTPVSFVVEENDDLTNSTIVMSNPANNSYFNSLQTNFIWEDLVPASSYIFQLIKGDENATNIIEQTNTTDNFYFFSLQSAEESLYTWKVKGLNSSSNTEFSFRQFYIDITAPNTATELVPSNGETTTTSVDFSWTLGADPGNVNAPLTTTFEVASDTNFTNLIYSEETSSDELSYTFSSVGTYYWRLITRDEAGNIGDYSVTHQIIIQ